jgi:hypothetical protein
MTKLSFWVVIQFVLFIEKSMKSEFYVLKYILDTYIVKYKLPTHAFVRCIVVFKWNNNIS